jgi:hypothetical protein
MPLTRFQGVADEEVVIPDEEIGDFIAAYPQPVLLGLDVAWQKAAPRGNVPVTFPRWNQMADGVPSAKAETDEFEERDIAMSDASITPALFGFALKRSDEAEAGSPSGVRAGMLVEGLNYHYTQISSAVLSGISGLAASTGLVGDTYDLTRVQADIAAYQLLELDNLGAPVAAISAGMATDLTSALHASSATMPTASGDSLSLGPGGGFMGVLYEIPFYRTTQLPVSTTGRAGAIMPVGQQRSPLGLAVKEMPNVRTTRGDEMERRAATQHILRAWYGTGTTNDRNGTQILGPA